VNSSDAAARADAPLVLASGLDSVVVAVSLRWPNDATFKRLAQLKQAAKEREDGEPFQVSIDENATARFVVKPNGKDGFEWLLTSGEMGIALGNWIEPKQRPSAMVDIRSEALWRFGADAAVARAVAILEAMGADVEAVKPSRLDLCTDVLLGEQDWHAGLDQHFVTRARGTNMYRKNRDLSGFSLGSGEVVARLYDKPREIREQSGKEWMYPIWKLPAVPEGCRIIRVEFQVRRDALREFQLNAWDDVRGALPRLWAYCTRDWLRLAVDPQLHHTQQDLLAWWAPVQNGFAGAQGAEPLVRELAVNTDLRRLGAQAIGALSSIVAIKLADRDATEGVLLDPVGFLHSALSDARKHAPQDDAKFTRRIDRKRARLARAERFEANEATASAVAVESAPDAPEGSA